MDVDRRSLMKGMLASGALLALGLPSWTFADRPLRTPRQCLLLLGGTSADDMFESGARIACARMNYKDMQTLKLKGGLLAGADSIIQLLRQSRDTRWIAIMDDASAVIFLELARTAVTKLLSMGTHACSADSSCQLRHTWATTAPAYSVGGLLASHFANWQNSFWITETFLHATADDRALTSWSAPGFSSYRLHEPEAIHMHCSGLSLIDGCRQLGWETSEAWIAIPPQLCSRESVIWESEHWVKSVGYAVTTTALWTDSVQESCSGRAFMHRSMDETRTEPTARFVSFVMDF